MPSLRSLRLCGELVLNSVMAFRTDYTTEIVAPIGRVFAYLEDPEKGKLWRTGLLASERTKDVPGGVGSTFVERIREGRRVVEYAGEVIAWAPPRELGVRVGNRHFSADAVYRLAPLGDSRTRLDYTCDTTIHSRVIGLLLGWYIKAFSRRMLGRMMAKLKEHAEA